LYKIYLLVFIFTLIVPTNILGSYSYKNNNIKYSFPKSVLVSKKSDTFFYNDLGFRLFQGNCLIGNIYTTFPSKKSIQLIRKIEDKFINVEFGGEIITVKIREGFSNLNGSIILIDLGWKSIEDIKNFFDNKFKISLFLKSGEGFDLKNYFDTNFNSWSIFGISKALDEASKLCKNL
tara:strand:+ start:353 stop:883 length:531 start_codon:yes stop_codon:yes gene_type:complete